MAKTVVAASDPSTHAGAGGESPSPIGHWIGGVRVPGRSGRSAPVFNPASGRQTGAVDLASETEVDAAVQAAKEAFPTWSAIALTRRTELLLAVRDAVVAQAEEIARCITAEQGKTLDEARAETRSGIKHLEFACGAARFLKGDYSRQASSKMDVFTARHPLGVVAGITPFNVPFTIPLWMWAPAIVCGNTIVIKPSEKDPSVSLLTAEIIKSAGIPDGVVNVVNGDAVAVNALISHPDVQAVSFVGSSPAARYVYGAAAQHGKRAQAFGGGKNHMIVMPDADFDAAADAAAHSCFESAGERCMSVSVVVAVGDAGDPVVERLVQTGKGMRVGDGTEPGVVIGPLIAREHRDRVASYIGSAVEQGGELVLDGRDPYLDREGFFLGPSVIDRVTPEMDCYRNELFGPVLSVVRVESFDEAIALLNSHDLGNGAYLFTNDGRIVNRFQNEAQAGMVGVNLGMGAPVSWFSFGGWKDSFFGDRRIFGPEAIEFYTRPKTVSAQWL